MARHSTSSTQRGRHAHRALSRPTGDKTAGARLPWLAHASVGATKPGTSFVPRRSRSVPVGVVLPFRRRRPARHPPSRLWESARRVYGAGARCGCATRAGRLSCCPGAGRRRQWPSSDAEPHRRGCATTPFVIQVPEWLLHLPPWSFHPASQPGCHRSPGTLLGKAPRLGETCRRRGGRAPQHPRLRLPPSALSRRQSPSTGRAGAARAKV
jgi:hypothetical protein